MPALMEMGDAKYAEKESKDWEDEKLVLMGSLRLIHPYMSFPHVFSGNPVFNIVTWRQGLPPAAQGWFNLADFVVSAQSND